MSEDSPSDDVEMPDIEVSEEHVGKPVLSPETMIVGTITGVANNAYTVERDQGADFEKLSMGLVSSGDGKLAVMPGQIDTITEDGVYLK